MINIKNKQDCCGCGACGSICPQSCISMQPDEEGFLYPKVEISNCKDCGLCNQVCPFENPFESKPTNVIYACKNIDEETRIKSSSGGIFSILANYVLEQNGVVFGASFNEYFNVIHSYVKDKNCLKYLRGSKYVQSNLGNTFKQCRTFLDKGINVLFSGTPCQIAGLKHYLRREYENLICVDVVCHGVPSPKVWNKYKMELETTNNSRLMEFGFKNKITGWKRCSFAFTFVNGISSSEPAAINPYFIGFISEVFNRPSCHNCMAKNFRSGSDITLADYWGVDTRFPEIDDDKGISLFLVNNLKGALVFDKLKEKMEIIKTDMEHAVTHNPCIVQSLLPSPKRDKFFKLIDKLPFSKAVEKCLGLSVLQKLKWLIYGVRVKVSKAIIRSKTVK